MKRKAAAAFLAAAVAAPAAAEGGLKLLSFSTLVGEIITFLILVFVVMKFVWPPLMNAVETRQKEIADGLAAAEQGRQELAAADARKTELLADARAKAGSLLAEGQKRKSEIVDAARGESESENNRILEQGRRDLALERAAMCRELQSKVGELALSGAAQVLGREVDAKAHEDIIASLKKSMPS
ncbi:MAG: F0F1 ATP synthase subunit B [Gammaproteobacteria bacterium]